MAYVLTIIPKRVRVNKRAQALSCLKDSSKNIQQRLDCAAKAKQKLEAEVVKRNINLQQSIKAGKDLDTIG